MAHPTLQEVEQLATQLSSDDRTSLAFRLLRGRDGSGREKSIAKLMDKYAGAVPDPFDIDATLRECRSEWLKEIDAMMDGREIP